MTSRVRPVGAWAAAVCARSSVVTRRSRPPWREPLRLASATLIGDAGTARPRPVPGVLLRLAQVTVLHPTTTVSIRTTTRIREASPAVLRQPAPGPVAPAVGVRHVLPIAAAVRRQDPAAATTPSPVVRDAGRRIPRRSSPPVASRPVPEVPRVVVRTPPVTQQPTREAAARAVAPARGGREDPVPGWGGPLLPLPTPAAAPALAADDVRRLSEQVAARLVRSAVVARERRGEV